MNPFSNRLALDVGRATYLGNRRTQEDSFYDSPSGQGNTWFGVVSDGMGGHRGGDVASRIAVSVSRDVFSRVSNEQKASIAQALRVAVETAHKAVLAKARELGYQGDMGATVVALAVSRDTLSWCSSGDSRLYLARAGKLKQLSTDFTLAVDLERAVQAGHISREELNANPNKGALTSFLGADALRVDEGAIRLLNGDWFMVCTDGLYGTVGDEALLQVIDQAQPQGDLTAEMAIDILFRDYLFPFQKSNQDNSTAILVRVGDGKSRGRSVVTGLPMLSTATVAVVAIGLVAIGIALRNPLEDLIRRQLPSEIPSTALLPPPKSTVSTPSSNSLPSKQEIPALPEVRKEPVEPAVSIVKRTSDPRSEVKELIAEAKEAHRLGKVNDALAKLNNALSVIELRLGSRRVKPDEKKWLEKEKNEARNLRSHYGSTVSVSPRVEKINPQIGHLNPGPDAVNPDVRAPLPPPIPAAVKPSPSVPAPPADSMPSEKKPPQKIGFPSTTATDNHNPAPVTTSVPRLVKPELPPPGD